MRKTVLLFAIWMTTFCSAQEIRVMTYNIRYDNPGDGENRWELRREFLADQILFYAPDFIGTQEGKKHQLAYLEERLKQHSYIGKGRDASADGGEYSALFYNHEKFELLDGGTFWLSETPEKISKGWDGDFNRICTYGLFRDKKTQKKVYVFNTHFDHVGKLARLNSAKLIVSKIKEINKNNLTPVVLTGDFNSEPTSDAYIEISKFLKDSRTSVKPFGPSGTFNGFDFHKPVTTLIDFIFSTSDLTVIRNATLSDSKDCRYPSDHLPVLVDFRQN